jgi:hypothetical protein
VCEESCKSAVWARSKRLLGQERVLGCIGSGTVCPVRYTPHMYSNTNTACIARRVLSSVASLLGQSCTYGSTTARPLRAVQPRLTVYFRYYKASRSQSHSVSLAIGIQSPSLGEDFGRPVRNLNPPPRSTETFFHHSAYHLPPAEIAAYKQKTNLIEAAVSRRNRRSTMRPRY